MPKTQRKSRNLQGARTVWIFAGDALLVESEIENVSLTDPVMSDVHHEIVHFSGRVQGVGFRYTTLQVAKEFEVAGYVKNLTDGRVQLEAEGAKSQINAFVQAVQERMHGYIKNMERQGRPRPSQFKGFTIK